MISAEDPICSPGPVQPDNLPRYNTTLGRQYPGLEKQVRKLWIAKPEIFLLFHVHFIIFLSRLSSLKVYQQFIDYLPAKCHQKHFHSGRPPNQTQTQPHQSELIHNKPNSPNQTKPSSSTPNQIVPNQI